MALTKTPIELSSTQGIVDNSNATAITIDSSENVGIGVVPKTWYSASTALEIGSMSFEDYGVSGANVSVFANNLYRNTSNAYVYKESDFAASYSQYNGEHTFNTAPSGTADSAATLTAVMKIDSSGNVGVGTALPTLASAWNKVLHVQSAGLGSSIRLADSASGTSGEVGLLMGQYSNSSYIINRDSSNMYFWTGGQERVRLDSSGNLLVGTTDDVVWNNNANSAADNGHNLRDDGRAGFAYYNATANSNATVNINRTGSDGDLIRLFKSGTTVGSIGTVSGDIRIGGLDDNHASIRFAASSKAVLPVKNSDGDLSDNTTDLGASNARFKYLYLSGGINNGTNTIAFSGGAFAGDGAGNDANIDLGRNNRRFQNLYLSGGVVFGSTGGSVTSKTLDDYEEGTWIPTYTDDSGNVITNLTSQGGSYVKVGNLVYISGNLRTQSSSSASGLSGFLSISGLPFTQSSGTAGTVSFYTHVSVPTYNAPSELPRTSPLVSNTTRIAVYKYSGTGGRTTRFAVSDLNMSGNSNFMFFSGTYRAS